MVPISQEQYRIMSKFRDDVLDLLERTSSFLSTETKDEVLEFIKQNESGAALETLAWAIVEQKKQVPKEIIDDILRLAKGIIDHEHMPDNLISFAA